MLNKLVREQFDFVYEIMKKSFPTDEHRPYEEQKGLFSHPEYEIYTFCQDETGDIQGFLAVWEFDEIIFIEHFAVAPSCRNLGIGSRMLESLKTMSRKRLCLEVELPEDELTKRRVEFYKRNGFFLNEYPYMQPALSEGQREVPLSIMTTEGQLSKEEFVHIKKLLYEKVYQKYDLVPQGSIYMDETAYFEAVGTKGKMGCRICPRECNVDRRNGKTGYCGVSGVGILGARAALHMWEEPCISGDEGSGTVFFSGCPLRCVYCQNYDIAHGDNGTEITLERLSEIFLELQEKGANNINLVTPTHYSLEIIKALDMAKKKGLKLPIVYNCSGYEKVETLRLLEGFVDVYLTDFKYMNHEIAKRYSHAADYTDIAKTALEEMVRQQGQPEFDERGIMLKGVIVRHLLLPGQIQNGKDVVKYVYETYGDRVFLSLMNQYTPLPHVKKYPEINCRVTEAEYDELVDYAIEIGVENGFIQEGETAAESFIPAFNHEGWN